MLIATGGHSPWNWQVIGGGLPDDILLDTGPHSPNRALLSGVANVAGNYTFTVRVTESTGGWSQKTFTLAVLELSALANPACGTPYSETISMTGLPVGATVTYSVVSGTIPAGLTMTGAGVVSGIMTDATGTFAVGAEVTLTDGTTFNCTKEYTLTPEDCDMGLTHAVYVASENAIYGVRGGTIHKFNASTGAKTASLLLSKPGFDDTAVIWHPIMGYLYVYAWQEFPQRRGVYAVDPDLSASTLTTTQTIASSGATDNWEFPLSEYMGAGMKYGVYFNGYLVWIYDTGNSPDSTEKYLASWSGFLPIESALFGADAVGMFQQLDYNQTGPTTAHFWILANSISGPINRIYRKKFDTATNTFSDDGFVDHVLSVADNRALVYASDGFLYTTGLNGFITKVDVTTGEVSTHAIGYPTVDKFRIRESTIVGKEGLYVPLQSENKVLVVNTSTWAVTEKTGFNWPFDIVVTGDKVFAVQLACPSLKEIV
jgi:hypothetical protein